MDQAADENQATTEGGNQRQPLIGPDRRAPKLRLDLTINIPTMISLLVLIFSVSAWGVGIYYNFDKRHMQTEYAVANLNARVEKVENSVAAIKADQATTNSNLRTEIKADLAEIKGQINQLIFTPQQQRQLREWSR